VLIQPFVDYPGSTLTTAGEAWRQVRNQVIIPYGGALLLIVLLAIGIFYFTRGPIGGRHPDTGRKIERFTPLERSTHWTVAISFAVLGISGIVMAFGKFFLLPIMGGVLFGWLTYALKTAHNFAGPLFVVGLLVMLVTYARDNLPRAADVAWLARAGGMLGGKEMPSHRFNGGEKLLFWGGVLVLGLVVSVSGLFLDQLLPGFLFTRGEMQVAHMVHGAASMVMMALFIGHIYMGTVGVKGAYGAMRNGYVDEAWAQDHHALWAEDVRAGRIPAQRSGSSTPPPVATKHA
jgi:formate dehydrogenase subunit gamma